MVRMSRKELVERQQYLDAQEVGLEYLPGGCEDSQRMNKFAVQGDHPGSRSRWEGKGNE